MQLPENSKIIPLQEVPVPFVLPGQEYRNLPMYVDPNTWYAEPSTWTYCADLEDTGHAQ